MIKLNNKNITYVALADTNNSLKAPKEIWYADSSNSVKLVYRRKDALIEGEDYEKYHWLVGEGTAYINSPSVNAWVNRIETQVYYFANHSIADRYFYYKNADNILGLAVDRLNEYLMAIWRGYSDLSHLVDIYTTDTVYTYEFWQENNSPNVIVNGTTYNGSNTILESTWNKDINVPIYARKMSYFRVKLTDDTYHSNLIPCKLLKPVPKWLDANGIRRQVGECGMIDLVSGKFYGNVNNVGTFTVENYYERKEWLIADIPSNTRCIDLPINSNKMSYSMLIKKVSNNTFFETISNYRYYTTTGSLPSIRVWDIPTSSEVNVFNVGLQENELFNITSNESSLTINGVEVQKIGFPISAVVLRSGVHTNNGITETSSVFVDEIERYIPCKLTMDLPASMDANGIARPAGTCGMWDLVSDRFYGNVANSGTFKAVNLAEGVDYEVHDWLYTELPEANSFMILPIGSDTFSFNRVFYKTNSVGFFRTNGYLYYSSQQRIRLWDINSSRMLFASSQYQYGELIQVISNSNSDSVTIKDSSIPKYAYDDLDSIVVDFREAYTDGNFASKFKTSKITVDGIERYIPVKLLRSIPSKYDANGIARQVGECGMYDTVNDVFYGNVASSGTFSVSDDS